MPISKDRRPPMPGALTDEDMALWRRATRTDKVLPRRRYAEEDQENADEIVFQHEETKEVSKNQVFTDTLPAKKPQAQGAGLDRRTATRLRRGQIPIDSRLDLHGLTQKEAHASLIATLTDAQARGERCVLVITGKGLSKEGGGVLKTMLPRWLGEPTIRPMVIGKEVARPHHGGSGALYVLLRRLR